MLRLCRRVAAEHVVSSSSSSAWGALTRSLIHWSPKFLRKTQPTVHLVSDATIPCCEIHCFRTQECNARKCSPLSPTWEATLNHHVARSTTVFWSTLDGGAMNLQAEPCTEQAMHQAVLASLLLKGEIRPRRRWPWKTTPSWSLRKSGRSPMWNWSHANRVTGPCLATLPDAVGPELLATLADATGPLLLLLLLLLAPAFALMCTASASAAAATSLAKGTVSHQSVWPAACATRTATGNKASGSITCSGRVQPSVWSGPAFLSEGWAFQPFGVQNVHMTSQTKTCDAKYCAKRLFVGQSTLTAGLKRIVRSQQFRQSVNVRLAIAAHLDHEVLFVLSVGAWGQVSHFSTELSMPVLRPAPNPRHNM